MKLSTEIRLDQCKASQNEGFYGAPGAVAVGAAMRPGQAVAQEKITL